MKNSFSDIISVYVWPAIKGAAAAVLVICIIAFEPLVNSIDQDETEPPASKYYLDERTPEEIREAQMESEPYVFDEYGIRYCLSDDYDHYYLDESYEPELETPDSTCFTSIGYHPFSKTLWVVFRNTGAGYHYYDVPHEVWYEFKNAESKGGYFQEAIRGYYEYDRD